MGTVTTYESETQPDADSHIDALTVDNTLWTNTVVASGTAVGLVVYTGSESRRYCSLHVSWCCEISIAYVSVLFAAS